MVFATDELVGVTGHYLPANAAFQLGFNAFASDGRVKHQKVVCVLGTALLSEPFNANDGAGMTSMLKV